MQKYMLFFMPIMIAWISFRVPLGMGLYWFVNTLVTILLQVWMNYKIYGSKNNKGKTKLLDEGGIANG